VHTDLAAFAEAAAAGRSEDAIERWAGGLADGLALDGAPEFEAWLHAERERLRGLWRRAMQQQLERFAALPDVAVPLLERLLADEPLHEPHHLALMQLHAAAGRRDAALAQFERCKRLLHEELGLAPMAATQAVAEALLAAAAAPASNASRAAAPRVPPALQGAPAGDRGPGPVAALRLPAALPFVGREAEAARLEAGWRAGHSLWIEGAGGVGKSRLAADFAAAHGPHATVRCRPADSAVPYAALARALKVLAGPAPATTGLPRWAVVELARLLPALGEPPPPMARDDERARFAEAVALAWAAWAHEGFDAVLLDDWHLADDASRALLAFLAQRRQEEQGAGGAREVFVARPAAAGASDAPKAALLAGGTTTLVEVRPLAEEEVFELVRRLSRRREPRRFAARLAKATGGAPYFIAETLRHLAERGWLTADADGVWHTPIDDATADYAELPLPASVHATVLARVEPLSAAARRVLEAASLAHEPFQPALLAPACAFSELDATIAIDEAVRAELLREHAEGGWAFVHDLAQQAVAGSLAPERQRLLHRRLALAAEASRQPPAVTAAHFEAAGEPARAVPHLIAAGRAARSLYRWHEAIALWQRAIALGPTPAQQAPLHWPLQNAFAKLGDTAAARAQRGALQALIERGGLAGAELDAARLDLAQICNAEGDGGAALAWLERLPASAPVPAPGEEDTASASIATSTRALIIRSEALRLQGRIDEARAAGEAALAHEGLREFDRLHLHLDLTHLEHVAARPPEALAHLAVAERLAAASGHRYALAVVHFMRDGVEHHAGRHAQALAATQRAAVLYEEAGTPGMQRVCFFNLAAMHGALGDAAAALAAAERGWAMRPPLPRAAEDRIWAHIGTFEALYCLGRFGEALEHAQEAIAQNLERGDEALAQAIAMTMGEGLWWMGQGALLEPMLARLDDERIAATPQTAHEHWVVRAEVALLEGTPQVAANRLARLPAPETLPDPRLRRRFELARRWLAFAQGAALPPLPAPEAEGMTEELRWRRLHLVVLAEAATGLLGEGTAALAACAVADPPAHRPAALHLLRALAAAQRAGVAGVPQGAIEAHAALCRGLADSLAAHPEAQRAFLARQPG
jgi:tetratricopeptide (TPR) repeat protein